MAFDLSSSTSSLRNIPFKNDPVQTPSGITATPTNRTSTIPLNISVQNAPIDRKTTSSNPYSSINTFVDPNKVTNFANQQADTLNPSIQGLQNLSTQKVDTSGAPDTSLQPYRDKIEDIANKGVTQETMNKFASLRPKNEFEDKFTTGLDRLNQYAEGKSLVDETIANKYIGKFDASAASANMAQAQRIASNPYLSTGAKQAAMQETNRTAATQRSELVSDLSAKAQERAYEATKDYANMTLQAAQYKEDQYRTDLSAATNEVNTQINAAISSGNLASNEISNNINVWNTKVNTQIQDLNRSLSALVSSGQLTSDQAKMRMDGILESSRIEQQNITNELNKAAGIASWQSQQTQDEVAKANVKQIEQNIINAKLENYKSANSLLTSTVLDYREKNQGTAEDDWESASQNGMIRSYMENTWKSIPGNENTPMDDDWASSYYGSIRTTAETAKIATDNKLKSLKSTWVDQMGMKPEVFGEMEKQLRLVADFGGTIRQNNDGSWFISDAEGNPLNDTNNQPMMWDSNGNRITTKKESTETNITDFNAWKSANLVSGDTEGYSDSDVLDAYNQLKSEGKTPTRTNIREMLEATAKKPTTVTSVKYEDYMDLLNDNGADIGKGKITKSSPTSGKYLDDIVVSPTQVRDILAYEKANPDKANILTNNEIMDFVPSGNWTTRPRVQSKNLTTETHQLEDKLTSNVGKFTKLNGKDVVILGLSDTGLRKWKIYDVETGQTKDYAVQDFQEMKNKKV